MMDSDLTKRAQEFFRRKKALILDPNSITRTVFRKFIESIGVPRDQVHQSESLSEGLEILKSISPEIIFTEFDLGKENAFSLLDEHVKLIPNRLNCCFVIFGPAKSPSLVTSVADSECDLLLSKPFTLDLIQEKFLESISYKFKPSDLDKSLDEIKALLRKENYQQVIEETAKLESFTTTSVLLSALRGLAYLKLNNIQNAQACFENGLKISPHHYLCLKNLILIQLNLNNFKSAYEYALLFTQHYSIPGDMLPILIKTALANEQFEDIMNFHRLFLDIDLESEQETLAPTLAAGMTLAGQWLYQKERKQEGIQCLEQAVKVAKGKSGILKKIINIYLEVQEYDRARNIFDQIEASGNMSSQETKILEIQVKAADSPAPEIIKLAMDAKNQGIKHPQIYEILLKKSQEIGRDSKFINDLAQEAISEFPQNKQIFIPYLD